MNRPMRRDDRLAHTSQTYVINVSYDSPTSSDTAGAAVRLTLKAMLRANVDDAITIDLAEIRRAWFHRQRRA